MYFFSFFFEKERRFSIFFLLKFMKNNFQRDYFRLVPQSFIPMLLEQGTITKDLELNQATKGPENFVTVRMVYKKKSWTDG